MIPNPLGIGHSARAVEGMWYSRQDRIYGGNTAARPIAPISAVSPTPSNQNLGGPPVPRRTNPSTRADEEMWPTNHGGPPPMNMTARPTASNIAVSPIPPNQNLGGPSVPRRANPSAGDEMWYTTNGGPPPVNMAARPTPPNSAVFPPPLNQNIEYPSTWRTDLRASEETRYTIRGGPPPINMAARPTGPINVVFPTSANQHLGGPAVLQRTNHSAEWMKRADEVVEVMAMRSAPRPWNPRVKVAILDTGVDPSHGFAQNEYQRDHRYFDFVENGQKSSKQPNKDNTKHGTEMLNLVLSMHAYADVYIARVFETKYSSGEPDAIQMAKAIGWAIWAEVDIISISAGFVEDYAVVRQAIARANAAGILIFAAAANWGNMDRVAYPAANDEVFCVFASDGLNKRSAYNPEARTRAVNFAFLGNDVDVHRNGLNLSNGTSTATALLAGFAAQIIDFSRHGDSIRAGIDPPTLRTRAGMRTVLMHISHENEGFHCIAPWKLWGIPQGDHTSRARFHEAIKRALEALQ